MRPCIPAAFAALSLAALLAAGCSHRASAPSAAPGPGPTSSASAGKALNITMIPKGATHDFWKSVHAGADDAAKKNNVTLNWQAPNNEQDSARETTLVETAVTTKADGIAVAPINKDALVGAVQTANKANIPVTIFDSAIGDGADYVSFVATDNTKGGEMAAEQMGKALGGKGKVALVPVTAGSASTQAREDGFRDVMKKNYPGIQVFTLAYGNADRTQSLKVAEDALIAHPDLNGFYGPNESSTVGELEALKNHSLAGKVTLVGFDATQPLVDSVKKGEIAALIVQNPYKIGYDAIDLLVQKIKGGSPPKRDDTGVNLVTKDTLATPDIQKLLQSQKITP